MMIFAAFMEPLIEHYIQSWMTMIEFTSMQDENGVRPYCICQADFIRALRF